MSNNCAKCNVTNPIPASQIVDVNLDWGSLEAPTCTDLPSTLQSILNAIDNEEEVDLKCIVEGSEGAVQSIVDHLCNEEATDPTSQDKTLNISLCSFDDWNCVNSSCIEISPCSTVISTEEYIQALYNRINSQSTVIADLCERLATLETCVEDLKNTDDCCDLSSIESRVSLVESNITTINNNCC